MARPPGRSALGRAGSASGDRKKLESIHDGDVSVERSNPRSALPARVSYRGSVRVCCFPQRALGLTGHPEKVILGIIGRISDHAHLTSTCTKQRLHRRASIADRCALPSWWEIFIRTSQHPVIRGRRSIENKSSCNVTSDLSVMNNHRRIPHLQMRRESLICAVSHACIT